MHQGFVLLYHLKNSIAALSAFVCRLSWQDISFTGLYCRIEVTETFTGKNECKKNSGILTKQQPQLFIMKQCGTAQST
jgi:hypothetical protein